MFTITAVQVVVEDSYRFVGKFRKNTNLPQGVHFELYVSTSNITACRRHLERSVSSGKKPTSISPASTAKSEKGFWQRALLARERQLVLKHRTRMAFSFKPASSSHSHAGAQNAILAKTVSQTGRRFGVGAGFNQAMKNEAEEMSCLFYLF